ncbi:MAG: crAss001_48 related protein [Polaribacter sp.]|uniref:crAss001_48 related protein n=1 Tax=Polaribacter sp. TaxID=1920175 RepID=UPI003EF11FC1
MNEALVRVTEEKQQLSQKVDALEKFIKSDLFTEIDRRQQSLLKIQLPAMKMYLECLSQRIETF